MEYLCQSGLIRIFANLINEYFMPKWTQNERQNPENHWLVLDSQSGLTDWLTYLHSFIWFAIVIECSLKNGTSWLASKFKAFRPKSPAWGLINAGVGHLKYILYSRIVSICILCSRNLFRLKTRTQKQQTALNKLTKNKLIYCCFASVLCCDVALLCLPLQVHRKKNYSNNCF